MRIRSKEKINVSVRSVVGKPWAHVADARNGRTLLIPSMEDLFRIILAIIYCENHKYPHLPWPAAQKVGRFLAACVQEAQRNSLPMSQETYEATWSRLAKRFKLEITSRSSTPCSAVSDSRRLPSVDEWTAELERENET
jgi:hypothetical protein